MRRHRALLPILLIVAIGCSEQQWPYDETANAPEAVAAARLTAEDEQKLLMLIFGANWCEDCRRLDTAMQAEELANLLETRFVVTKVNVGNWNQNLDLVTRWGDPIAGGIPALVIAEPQGKVIYSTAAGELASARHLGDDDLYLFFAHLAELPRPLPFADPS